MNVTTVDHLFASGLSTALVNRDVPKGTGCSSHCTTRMFLEAPSFWWVSRQGSLVLGTSHQENLILDAVLIFHIDVKFLLDHPVEVVILILNFHKYAPGLILGRKSASTGIVCF